MQVARYFTVNKGERSVYDMFDWKMVDVVIKDQKTDTTLFEGHDLEFPKDYSQNACDIIAKMYFRKTGVPETGHETSMRQVAHRMVHFWVLSMIEEGLITDEDKDIVYDELVYMLLNQMWAPNSPQWFNTGLKHAYGITGEKSQEYYWDKHADRGGKVVESDDGYTRSQASACFIVGVKDSLLGEQSLMDNLTTASRLFKYGSGVGSNWSKIRAAGEHLSGGGISSGLLSFQKVYDRNAGAIKSGGVTRRAAVMQVLNIDHPEILDFVRWKSREEDKVVALGKMGYDVSIAGDAYETVSGQNVNNSVSIPDKFMKKVESGDETATWELIGRIDTAVNKKIKALDLWEEICWAAWRCGDPGVQYSDIINSWNTCPKSGRINGSNPCSEYLFLDDTSCNLASINVLKFFIFEEERFDFDGYIHAIKMIQMVLEATIHWGQFPTPQIAENTYKFRTTGLGLTNMGALIMYLGIPYDSIEARSICAMLCSVMTGQAYLTSAQMAEDIGPFMEYSKNKKYMMDVVLRHENAFRHLYHPNRDPKKTWNQEISSLDSVGRLFSDEMVQKATKIWADAVWVGGTHGFRNAQVTVLAPTGTIAFAMDCDTTSSEPFFSHKIYKKVVDGSWIETVNRMIPMALKHLGYSSSDIASIEQYVRDGDGKIEGAPHLRPEHYAVFDTASRCGSGERFLSPEAHVKMVAACTPHLSGGISKTVNLPAEATVEDIKHVYKLAWELGCKCIALYRDTCKVVQPLTTTKDQVKDPNDIEQLNYWELLKYTKDLQQKLTERPKLVREKIPFEPKCLKSAVKMGGYTFHIQRSFYDDGRLGEIFVTAGKQGDTVKGLMEVLCILVSKALQYGIPVEVISDILRNTEFSPKGIVKNHPYVKSAESVTDLISKFMDMSIGDYSHCQVKPVPPEYAATPMKLVDGRFQGVVPSVEGTSNLGKLDTKSIFEGLDGHTKDLVDAYLKSVGISVHDVTDGKVIVNGKEVTGERVYGRTCSECGSKRIIKAGTCYYCQDCGTSSGCS